MDTQILARIVVNVSENEWMVSTYDKIGNQIDSRRYTNLMFAQARVDQCREENPDIQISWDFT